MKKYIELLIDPTIILLIFLFLSLLFMFFNKRRLALILGGFSFLSFVTIIAFDPGQLIFKFLDDRFPKTIPIEKVDGFIILGGIVDVLNSHERGEILLTDRAERITEIPILMRRYPDAQFIFTGAGLIGSEGDFAVDYLNALGIDASKLLLESRSTTTYENAQFTYQKYKPKPDENWYLLTSSWHMPRAIGVFRKTGWKDIKAWPVDYRTGQHYHRVHRFTVGSRFYNLSLGIKELAGLTFYHLRGWSDEWIPRF